MIKIIIERHVAGELIDYYHRASRNILQMAMQSRGFISGESLKNSDDPNHRLIIASYDTSSNWSLWYHSDQRKALMEELRPMLVEDEKITVFEHI
ncbi:antibiotic biosynthesis monooxygenase [Motiliproteus sp. MSK22-1]|uniref:antibiotic biosynthesis monooxygenase n=1 Tax=Motiliproteus sp. MSK22-1 TaxID=1897630 RepID=UPI00097574F0|nr:antibiotic biosynthesis monooxygenase [Motiliproteus sp. MSK22-1]OMH38741.1 antibiotic biosynthesis monooxygenase [Motiliproteus sp. MSK22-1]